MKPSDSNITLRVYIDHSVIEAYAQGGRAVITSRTYPMMTRSVRRYCKSIENAEIMENSA